MDKYSYIKLRYYEIGEEGMRELKIMEFFGEPISYGGQETFIMNMYSHFKRNAEYTFVTPFVADNKELIDLISNKKDVLIADDYNFNSTHRKKYIWITGSKYISSDYDVLHVHTGSILTLLMVAFIAKKNKVKKVIVHSHATGYKNIKHTMVKKLADCYLDKFADYFLACSREAALFKFSSRVIQSNRFMIIKNGIDVNRYRYNDTYRKEKRKEFGLEKEVVLCNVGRYSEEKNQKFVLNVFCKYREINPNSKLLLVGGNGPLKVELKQEIERLGIASEVLMLTERNDVNEILSSVDVFLFPSLFEGLGISAIEAQASGLPTICSENIPDEACISQCFYKIPLEEGAQAWAQFISELSPKERESSYKEIVESGYSAENCAASIEEIYFLTENK